MNWNKNNNDNNPWGSGGGKNPWSGGNSNNMDFEDSIRKAKERFGKFKIGGPRNLSILIIIALLIWLATGFYRVEPDEQGLSYYSVNGIKQPQNQVFIISFLHLLERQ